MEPYFLRGLNNERALDEDPRLQIADGLVWPFINNLAGYDFEKDAGVGEHMTMMLLDRAEDYPDINFRLIVDARRVLKDEDSKRGEIATAATITVETTQPQLTRPMYNQYAAAILRGDSHYEDVEPLRHVAAWEVQEFVVKRFIHPETLLKSWLMRIFKRYELQSKKTPGLILCNDRQLLTSALGQQEDDITYGLNDKLSYYSIAKEDISFLYGALKRTEFEGWGTVSVHR